MSDAISRYRELQVQLWKVRFRHEGLESEEEDSVLEQMDPVWWDLSERERAEIKNEGPKCWPMVTFFGATRFAALNARPGSEQLWSYQGFAVPQDAILFETEAAWPRPSD